MAKFSIEYVKKNPVLFGVIFVVFGLLLWVLMNRGGGSSGAQYVTTGPSEALQAAQMQTGAAIQAKQIDAAMAANSSNASLAALSQQIQGQQAIASMGMQVSLQQLAIDAALGSKQIDASLLALQAQLDNQLDITTANNTFMVDYARVASDGAVQQVAINAALQRALSSDQLQAYQTGALASVIPTLKGNDRDNTLNYLIGKTIDGPAITFNMHGDGLFIG